MSEQEAQAEEPLRMSAYYYSFEPTGVIEVDRILSAVARAGKAYHHTEQWDEPAYGGETSPVDWIQAAANAAGAVWERARHVPVEVTDEDIQRGVKIALDEGLAGRTWPEYVRAVYDAVSTRPAALGGGDQ